MPQVHPKNLVAAVNNSKWMRGIMVGGLKLVDRPMRLGDLRGNEFTIVLRQVDAPADVVATAVESWSKAGFVNYYGLQRFGMGLTPNHVVGIHMLKNDWAGAVDRFVGVKSDNDGEDAVLKQAREYYASTKDARGAANMLPYFMETERAVLQGLAKFGDGEPYAALNFIPPRVRLLFIHAFQVCGSQRSHSRGVFQVVDVCACRCSRWCGISWRLRGSPPSATNLSSVIWCLLTQRTVMTVRTLGVGAQPMPLTFRGLLYSVDTTVADEDDSGDAPVESETHGDEERGGKKARTTEDPNQFKTRPLVCSPC